MLFVTFSPVKAAHHGHPRATRQSGTLSCGGLALQNLQAPTDCNSDEGLCLYSILPSCSRTHASTLGYCTRQARGRLARQHTCCVDDAMCPAGISKALKFLGNIMNYWWLSGVAIQQTLHLHAVHLTLLGPSFYDGDV